MIENNCAETAVKSQPTDQTREPTVRLFHRFSTTEIKSISFILLCIYQTFCLSTSDVVATPEISTDLICKQYLRIIKRHRAGLTNAGAPFGKNLRGLSIGSK